MATIFVRLVDEAVLVWRPVEAEPLGEDRYLISRQEYDPDLEPWEFEPGDEVVVETVRAADGPIMAAVRRTAAG